MTIKTVIILVNYNSWKDTLECVESLNQIKLSDFIVIVVDNCSKDNSYENLKVVLNENPIVTLIQSAYNGGFAMGNNMAVKYALEKFNPEYFWFLNNDTILKDDALEPMIEVLEKNNDVGIVGSKLLYYSDPDVIQAIGGKFYKWYGKMKIIGFNEKDEFQYDNKNISLDFVVGASMLVRQSFIQKVGYMCEDYFLYFEEIDWSIRAKKLGLRTVCCSESVVYHKEGSSTKSDSRGKININAMYFHLNNLIIFYRKFYPLLTPISVMVVCYRILKSSILIDKRFLKLFIQIFIQKPSSKF